jgi:hypothetical protein
LDCREACKSRQFVVRKRLATTKGSAHLIQAEKPNILAPPAALPQPTAHVEQPNPLITPLQHSLLPEADIESLMPPEIAQIVTPSRSYRHVVTTSPAAGACAGATELWSIFHGRSVCLWGRRKWLYGCSHPRSSRWSHPAKSATTPRRQLVASVDNNSSSTLA